MRALVIDDAKPVRMILGELLREIGYEVFEAADGAQALARLEERGAPELVLCDWNMPNMNGLEFLCALRAKPAYAAVRVMMVTTEADLAHVEQALNAGADEYVMKPFTREILRDKLALLGLTAG